MIDRQDEEMPLQGAHVERTVVDACFAAFQGVVSESLRDLSSLHMLPRDELLTRIAVVSLKNENLRLAGGFGNSANALPHEKKAFVAGTMGALWDIMCGARITAGDLHARERALLAGTVKPPAGVSGMTPN